MKTFDPTTPYKPRRGRGYQPRSCGHCGNWFTPTSSRQKFCDRTCTIASRDGLTVETAEYIRMIASDPCCYCGNPRGGIDHIIPTARGGTSDWTNMTSCCLDCNRRKNFRPLLLWLGISTLEKKWPGWGMVIKSRFDYRTGERVS